MKKKLLEIILVATMATSLAGCSTEASRVSYNLSQQADNFNDVRQVTVINCLQGDVLFQMTGKMSITAVPASLISILKCGFQLKLTQLTKAKSPHQYRKY